MAVTKNPSGPGSKDATTERATQTPKEQRAHKRTNKRKARRAKQHAQTTSETLLINQECQTTHDKTAMAVTRNPSEPFRRPGGSNSGSLPLPAARRWRSQKTRQSREAKLQRKTEHATQTPKEQGAHKNEHRKSPKSQTTRANDERAPVN